MGLWFGLDNKNLQSWKYVYWLLFSMIVAGCGEQPNESRKTSHSTSSTSLQGKMQMEMDPLEVSLSCDSGIKKSVQTQIDLVKTCYQRRLKGKPSLKGRVRLAFGIHEDGSIEDVVLSDSTQDAALSHCIKRATNSWVFPKNCSTQVSFSFVFSP